jgi:hypothetical protein
MYKSSLRIEGCRLSGNTAAGGGAVYYEKGTLIVVNSFITGNSVIGSNASGGGVMNNGGTSEITSCVFSGNSTPSAYGGAVYNVFEAAGGHRVVNSSFYNNSDVMGGGAIFNNSGAALEVVNSAFAGNVPHDIYDDPGSGVRSEVAYSLLQESRAGEGNITGDPLFTDPKAGDLRLKPGSPCIDAADGDRAPAADIVGNPRYDDLQTPDAGGGKITYADVGAFEYAP